MPIRILIADDHAIIRAGLRSILEAHPEYLVVAEAGNGLEAVAAARLLAPEVVIMDLSMPGMGGIEATGAILRDHPDTRVIALSMHENRDFLTRMLKAGALGYVLKSDAAREILLAIEAVREHRTYLSPALVGDVLKDLLGGSGGLAPRAELSPRQYEVLQQILTGKSLKEIAFNLKLSVKTLEKHRQQIMARLGANSSAELAMIAVRTGLVDPWELG